jgi:GTP pyrophosphokinase
VRLAENARSRELGRGLLERELRKAGFSLARLIDDGRLEAAAGKELRKEARGSVEDLFAAVGYGKISPAAVVRALRPDWKPEPAPQERRERSLRNLFRRERTSSTGIRVNGHGDVLVRFGQCCSPLPGDDIVGFVTRGRGVTVHAADCRLAFGLDPERRIDVEWESEAGVAHQTRIRVVSRDEPGLLAKVTKTISGVGVNIGAARIATHSDQTATQTFDLWVVDARTLATVMSEIEKIKGVRTVERVRS